MRPQEQRRQPDEAFYFENGELVVDKELVETPLPGVELINGESVVGLVQTRDGLVHGRKYELSWQPALQVGDRLIGVQAGNEESVYLTASEDDEYRSYRPGGDLTGSYELKPGDLLIAKRHRLKWEPGQSASTTVILSAYEPLPGIYGEVCYDPLGYITAGDRLITWGDEGCGARRNVDLAIANSLVRTPIDLKVLDDEWGHSGWSFVGVLEGSELTRTYLDFFTERHGVDYMPRQDPNERWGEFPNRFTDQKFTRYLDMLLHSAMRD